MSKETFRNEKWKLNDNMFVAPKRFFFLLKILFYNSRKIIIDTDEISIQVFYFITVRLKIYVAE